MPSQGQDMQKAAAGAITAAAMATTRWYAPPKMVASIVRDQEKAMTKEAAEGNLHDAQVAEENKSRNLMWPGVDAQNSCSTWPLADRAWKAPEACAPPAPWLTAASAPPWPFAGAPTTGRS